NLNLLVDGLFGSKTLFAVKQWQKNHNLIEDGMVGPMTKAKMYEEGR
ncbi:MAG: peptidoglycan-binding domain-containing protein, partial [Candidatus Paceibacterota bacterium]